jgi:anoctamin-10
LAAIVPSFLAIYHTRAQKLTQWENHKHQSTFDTSLTIKTFALSSLVAYLGLGLSAFIYIPFGETVMNIVQQSTTTFNTRFPSPSLSSGLHTTKNEGGHAFFVSDMVTVSARAKLNHSRLQSQMFAYTVTNQATNFFFEVGLPFLTRAFTSIRSKRRPSLSSASVGNSKKKRVGFEDDKNGAARDEREFLERVRREVSLPQYTLPEDYDEMVAQFGYIALWSAIWPLAPCESSALLFHVCPGIT